MLKVFIVDDEKGVRHLLQHIINWKELNLELSGTADNGLSAYDDILHLQPDIVITDIRMQGMDGLELIQKVRATNNKVRFIIISGYQYFEYAHTAIKFGVDDFLLKPINKKEINGVLEKISNSILVSLENNRLISENKQENFRDSFITAINENVEPLSIADTNSKYHYTFIDGAFCVCIFKLDYDDVSFEFVDNIMAQFKRCIYDEFSGHCFENHVTRKSHSELLHIINYSVDSKSDIELIYDILLKKMLNAIYPYKILNLTIGLGFPVSQIADINFSLTTAKLASASRLRLGCDRLINSSKFNLHDEVEIKITSQYTKIEKVIDLLDPEKLALLFDSQVNDSNDFLSRYPFMVIQYAIELYTEYRTALQQMYPDTEMPSISAIEQQCTRFKSEKDVWKFIRATIIETLTEIQNRKKKETWGTLRVAKQYIEEHFSEDIGLREVANKLYLNANYFGALFKQETGINFHDYLVSVRLGKAKQLLKDRKYNIQKISEMVGYKDFRHFSKLFKNEVGLTPSEYKMSNLLPPR